MKSMKKLKKKYEDNGEYWKFQQEYEALFIQKQVQFFDEKIHIFPTFSEKEFYVQNSNVGNHILAIDFGGTQFSHTVTSVFEYAADGILKLIYYNEYPVNMDQTLVQDIALIVSRFNITKIAYDNKGGRYIEQQLQMKYPHILEPINFTTDKLEGYSVMKQMMATNKLLVPMDNKIITQIRNFTTQTNRS